MAEQRNYHIKRSAFILWEKEALKGIDLSINKGRNYCNDRSFRLRQVDLSSFVESDE